MIKDILEVLPYVENKGKYIPVALGKYKLITSWSELKQAIKTNRDDRRND